MVVWLTPPDREGVRWRIEMREDGRVAVYQMSDRWVSQTPQRRPRTMTSWARDCMTAACRRRPEPGLKQKGAAPGLKSRGRGRPLSAHGYSVRLGLLPIVIA